MTQENLTDEIKELRAALAQQESDHLVEQQLIVGSEPVEVQDPAALCEVCWQ